MNYLRLACLLVHHSKPVYTCIMCRRRRILLLFIACFLLNESEEYSLRENVLNRHQRQASNCSAEEFTCKSGECLPIDVNCDGLEDCQDGSDEDGCANIRCPAYLFTCAHGACINQGYRCDGKKHCKDNSDEMNCAGTLKPKPKCSRCEFQCDNDECIDDTRLCDGIPNCADASDESKKHCVQFGCPEYLLKCDYGACISADMKCNGKKECADGSDEKNCSISETETKSIRNDCILPSHPLNGRWVVYGLSNTYAPGVSVANGTLLQYQCNSGFEMSLNISLAFCNSGWSAIPSCVPITVTRVKAQGDCTIPRHPPNGQLIASDGNLLTPGAYLGIGSHLEVKCSKNYALNPHDDRRVTCGNGSWTKIPKCLKTCSSVVPAAKDNMSVRCSLNGYKVDCDTPVQGTQATYRCNALFEDWFLEARPNRYCTSGVWDFPPPRCVPICGLKSNQVMGLVAGGGISQKGDYPWMVGFYRTNDTKHFCSGTIITPKISLTAAHCFTDFGSSDPGLFKAAAGKYRRKYQDEHDTDAQYSNIVDLKIHEEYKNGQNFHAFDIAIVILEKPFTITAFVMPACIEYNANFNEMGLIGAVGLVPGWGFTTALDSPSDVLKELSLEYKAYGQCSLPADFRSYYTAARDKICGASVKKGENLCEGDSGGGLVFRQQRDRFYIRGIVSIGLRDKLNFGCDLKEHVLFTSVSYHADFIQQNL